MRIKHLFYLLLALPLAFVACEPEPAPKPEVKDPVLTLTPETLEVNYEAGRYSINYQIENPVEGVEIEATCTANWITDLKHIIENAELNVKQITFNVEKNELEEAREATIVVTYGDITKNVTVKQAAYIPAETKMVVEFAAAQRIPSDEVGLADNYFALAFADDAENINLGIVLKGAEGETVLKDGWYRSEEETLLIEECELFIWEPASEVTFANGKALVQYVEESDAYMFDINLLDENGDLYVFTYNGVVVDMIPAEKPEAEEFAPVKVEAYRTDTWDLGNFELDLYIDGDNYHSLDMQDNVNPNDKYLTAGHYSMADGSVTSWSNFIHNIETGEGAYVVAAEIDLTHNEDGTSTIKGYFESEYGKRLNVDWTGVVAGFDFSTEEPNPQPGEAVEFTATHFGGTYYNVGNHNYYIVLSDAEVDGSSAVDGATYYYFDLYSNNVNDDRSVPNGVYTFDASNAYASGTFTEQYGFGFKVNGSERLWYLYAEGSTVTVSDNKIVAELVLTDGTKHVVTYEGSLALAEESEGGSSLTGDLELNETGWDVVVEYYGQYYSDETDNYYVSLYEDADSGTGKWFVLDLMADYATCVDHRGTFTATEEYPAPNTFYTGLLDDSYLAGSWYAELENGEVAGVMAPLMEGTITVTLNADGSQTYVFDCKDDQGHKITGTVTADPYSTGYALNKGAQPKTKTYTMQLPKLVVR